MYKLDEHAFNDIVENSIGYDALQSMCESGWLKGGFMLVTQKIDHKVTKYGIHHLSSGIEITWKLPFGGDVWCNRNLKSGQYTVFLLTLKKWTKGLSGTEEKMLLNTLYGLEIEKQQLEEFLSDFKEDEE